MLRLGWCQTRDASLEISALISATVLELVTGTPRA
jgi:hypothetical protein